MIGKISRNLRERYSYHYNISLQMHPKRCMILYILIYVKGGDKRDDLN